MFAITMLPAGHGDAIVVEYGTPPRVRRVLIDAGPIHSYEVVRRHLKRMPDTTYEAFVVTHVDEDHIGGAVELLGDLDLRNRVRDVWFNGYVHCERGGNVLGPVDGERLTRAITRGNFDWNRGFPDPVSAAVGGPVVLSRRAPLPSIPLEGGARVRILSPSGPKLKRMAKVWKDVVEEAGLVPGEGADGKNLAPRGWHKDVAPIAPVLTNDEMRTLAGATPQDGSAANGSSIAFVFEYGGARVLLGADAHPSVLLRSLASLAAETGEARIRLDAIKLPHHGSQANVSTKLIEAIDASRYLVSSNGDTFGHPDDAALARVILASSRPAQIICNYATDRTTPWVQRARAAGAEVLVPAAPDTPTRVELA